MLNTGRGKLLHNPYVKIIIIPGAGHFIPWEHFDIIKAHSVKYSLTEP